MDGRASEAANGAQQFACVTRLKRFPCGILVSLCTKLNKVGNFHIVTIHFRLIPWFDMSFLNNKLGSIFIRFAVNQTKVSQLRDLNWILSSRFPIHPNPSFCTGYTTTNNKVLSHWHAIDGTTLRAQTDFADRVAFLSYVRKTQEMRNHGSEMHTHFVASRVLLLLWRRVWVYSQLRNVCNKRRGDTILSRDFFMENNFTADSPEGNNVFL